MALPKCFKTLGIVPATALLLSVYGLTHLSLHLLLKATVTCGRLSFRDVVAGSLGDAGVLSMQLVVIVNNLGGLVVFLIIIGDVLSGQGDRAGLLTPLGAPWSLRPVAVAFTVALVHTPLCLLRRMDSLKFTSALSMCLTFLFITITLSLVGDRIYARRIGTINWWPDQNASPGDVLKTLPVMLTAYVCHYNIHPIFSEMANPTEPRMRRVVTTALVTCTAIYWLVGAAAYVLFTDRTADDVLMNFGRDLDMHRGEAWVERAVKLGYAISLSCTFPLIQISLRQNIFDLAGWGPAPEKPYLFVGVTVRSLQMRCS